MILKQEARRWQSVRNGGGEGKLLAVALDLQQERQQAHALLDLLTPEQLGAIRSLLEVMVPDASFSFVRGCAANGPMPLSSSVAKQERFVFSRLHPKRPSFTLDGEDRCERFENEGRGRQSRR
ncbi:MAG TPA: hypothetical protein DEH78_10040 [Solibacterales bacterium]|nr:hypothetical protein [Bryobacterales bacterium]